jgi:hypothetical protein
LFLRNARYLPVGRSQAGDRHFKFHDERDNLGSIPPGGAV